MDLATALEITTTTTASAIPAVASITTAIAIATVTAATTAAFATVTAASAATTTAEVTARAFFLRASFAHGNRTSVEFLAVQGVDGFLAFISSAHSHEAEATGTLSHAIEDQVRIGDGSDRREQLLKCLFCRLEGEITYIEFHMSDNKLPPLNETLGRSELTGKDFPQDKAV